jgi:hypothetical protein
MNRMVCADCGKPVERDFDGDFTHTSTDDALACVTGDADVRAARSDTSPGSVLRDAPLVDRLVLLNELFGFKRTR